MVENIGKRVKINIGRVNKAKKVEVGKKSENQVGARVS